jgi:L-fuculokinase
MRPGATIVLDIGKTNAKLVLLDEGGRVIAEQRCANTIVNSQPYPHHDTERLWVWMTGAMREFAQLAQVRAIVPVTHGATAALVDAQGELVLPVLDYEYPMLGETSYASQRPRFAETLSPPLPAGLNLGRQLAWLQASFPDHLERATAILMYPQYWAMRLCGVMASEATSLGCHTDLWNPATQDYSSLVYHMGWRKLFPQTQPAWSKLGAVRADVAENTGLPADCQVVCGIHDSNASLLRYLDGGAQRTVLSTGTWMIAAAFGVALDRLDQHADMLANTNALGQPVACMRFMGGREFGTIAGTDPVTCGVADLERLIDQGSMAMPCFAESGGPFAGRAGSFIGPAVKTPEERYALATLYCALMTDYCLDALGAKGPITVEGSFTANPWFAPLLAALRSGQAVSQSDDASGTTCGGWMLDHWGHAPASFSASTPALTLNGLPAYRRRWLDAINSA